MVQGPTTFALNIPSDVQAERHILAGVTIPERSKMVLAMPFNLDLRILVLRNAPDWR